MNKLGEKSLKTLEYYEILEKLAGQAASQAAKEKCRALRPLDDHEQAELWLQQTTDAKDLMVRQGSPAFGGIREVGAILSRADRGGTLNPRELLAVASLLQTARRALLYDAEHETKTTLTPVFSLLSGNRDLEESITTAIISEEEIADGASPELLSIRRELRRVSGKVRETLNRMISGERSKYLQENIITQRNGRFVVPVKVEHRGDVPGLVHDTSSTGATVFVEPQQVVEINNQIKVLEGREENEIERILAELSSRVSMYKGAIEQDYDALTTLDFIFARAKLSFDMNACAPVLVEDGSRCFARAIRCSIRTRRCLSTSPSVMITTRSSSPARTPAARRFRSKPSVCCRSWLPAACIFRRTSSRKSACLSMFTPISVTSRASSRACPRSPRT